LVLHHPQRRQQGRWPIRIACDELFDLLPTRASLREHGLVRPMFVVSVAGSRLESLSVGRSPFSGRAKVFRRARRLLSARRLSPVARRRHRSISPMTISIDALIAMTSDNMCPSTMREIAARFTNDGGRMRQRTGLDEPSETM